LIKGDISNETARRLVVVIDAVAEIEREVSRKGFFTREDVKLNVSFNLGSLSHLWNVSNKYGLGVELIAFGEDGWQQSDLDSQLEKLDRRGLNPFNYAEVYPTISEFISFLPYRPNLQGVVDKPERRLRYGSYGINLETLGRG